MTSNDLEMTLGDLQMTLWPPTTVSLARTSKMLQKLSNIRVCSSYSSRFIEENPYFFLFFGEAVHKTGLYIRAIYDQSVAICLWWARPFCAFWPTGKYLNTLVSITAVWSQNISFRLFCQIFSACWYESSTNGLGGLILRIPAGPKFLSTTRKNLTILIFLSSLFVAHYCYTETLVIFYKITTWVVSRCIKNVHST